MIHRSSIKQKSFHHNCETHCEFKCSDLPFPNSLCCFIKYTLILQSVLTSSSMGLDIFNNTVYICLHVSVFTKKDFQIQASIGYFLQSDFNRHTCLNMFLSLSTAIMISKLSHSSVLQESVRTPLSSGPKPAVRQMTFSNLPLKVKRSLTGFGRVGVRVFCRCVCVCINISEASHGAGATEHHQIQDTLLSRAWPASFDGTTDGDGAHRKRNTDNKGLLQKLGLT